MESSEHQWSPLLGDFARVRTTGEVGEVTRYDNAGTGPQFVVQIYCEKSGYASEQTFTLDQLERC